MHTYKTKRVVDHSADEMFALVADVTSYPEFLPLCESLKVRERRREEGLDVIIADMSVAYKFLNESFTTRVLLDPASRQICVEYVDGPFKHLENRWHFEPLGQGVCEIHFCISYEFRSRVLQMLMGSVFDSAVRKFVKAFEERAREVYGTAEQSRSTPIQA